MAIDDASESTVHPTSSPSGDSNTSKFVAAFVVLAALVIGQIYTLAKLSSLRGSLETQQAAMRTELTTDLNTQLSTKMSALEDSTTQSLENFKKNIEVATKRVGSTSGALRKTRTLVEKFQTEQQQQNELLKTELAQKADQQQVGMLTEDVSATKTDLDSTKKNLEGIKSDLGMARSEFGTLIARNHDDIETLRKLGERDYFEFVLTRKQPQTVAGVGLNLKKTNVKRQRFTLVLLADDMQIEKKDRTANEPVFFSVGGSRKFSELVVNKVQSNEVRGYISTPKGAAQVAARSGGAR